jgi:hypothetical protein
MIPEKGPKRNPGGAIRKRVTHLGKSRYITLSERGPDSVPLLGPVPLSAGSIGASNASLSQAIAVQWPEALAGGRISPPTGLRT